MIRSNYVEAMRAKMPPENSRGARSGPGTWIGAPGALRAGRAIYVEAVATRTLPYMDRIRSYHRFNTALSGARKSAKPSFSTSGCCTPILCTAFAYSGMIPHRNSAALTAYYLGQRRFACSNSRCSAVLRAVPELSDITAD